MRNRCIQALYSGAGFGDFGEAIVRVLWGEANGLTHEKNEEGMR